MADEDDAILVSISIVENFHLAFKFAFTLPRLTRVKCKRKRKHKRKKMKNVPYLHRPFRWRLRYGSSHVCLLALVFAFASLVCTSLKTFLSSTNVKHLPMSNTMI